VNAADLHPETPNEVTFTKLLLVELSRLPGVRVWRQNCGRIPVRDHRGKILRVFDAGPPVGAADVSGIVRPEGFRLEVELKMPGGRRSAEQTRWAEFIAAAGGVYVLARFDQARSLADNLADATRAVADAIAARRRPA
jgi:hypothetical protein